MAGAANAAHLGPETEPRRRVRAVAPGPSNLYGYAVWRRLRDRVIRKMDKIIALHMPKCGGTSLKQSFLDIFGEKQIFFDYNRPFKYSARRRTLQAKSASLARTVTGLPRMKCVYGHFLPLKFLKTTVRGYQKFPDTFYMTFLRDPVDRAYSHYDYWKRHPDKNNRICQQMIREDWPPEKFFFHPFFRNLYSQFFYRFPVAYFDFIGITEDYEHSVECLSRLRPEFSGAAIYRKRVRARTAGDGWKLDPALRKDVEQYHAADTALYRDALSRLPEPHIAGIDI